MLIVCAKTQMEIVWSTQEKTMRSLLLLLLGIPIPIVILIALFVR